VTLLAFVHVTNLYPIIARWGAKQNVVWKKCQIWRQI